MSNSSKITIILFYEPFLDTLAFFLEKQPESNLKYFFYQGLILQNLSNAGILVAGVNIDNFLINSSLLPKFFDPNFELIFISTQIKTQTIESIKATNLYKIIKDSIAPEILFGHLKNSKSAVSFGSCVWSLGIYLFYILTNSKFFAEGPKNYEEFKSFYMKENIYQKIDENISITTDFKKLIKLLLNVNQQERTDLDFQSWLFEFSKQAKIKSIDQIDKNMMLYSPFLNSIIKTDEIDMENQLFLPQKAIFHGKLYNHIPIGKCIFTKGNLSMKCNINKGTKNGEIEVLDLWKNVAFKGEYIEGKVTNGMFSKLSLFDEQEIKVEFIGKIGFFSNKTFLEISNSQNKEEIEKSIIKFIYF